MSADHLKRNSEIIKRYADKGSGIIGVLREYMILELPTHLRIVQETSHSLLVDYYGLRLIFRIEIFWKGSELKAQIAAYSQSYGSEHQETPLEVAYEYEASGNIKRTATQKEFSLHFLTDVFTKAHAIGLHLRP